MVLVIQGAIGYAQYLAGDPAGVVRILDERTLLLPDRKTRHARTRRGDRVELRAITIGVAEVQDVGGSNILIETHSELIRVLMHYLRRRVDVGPVVWRWEIAQ